MCDILSLRYIILQNFVLYTETIKYTIIIVIFRLI